jgi:diguanylate cyclase (GGDEF)-like protein
MPLNPSTGTGVPTSLPPFGPPLAAEVPEGRVLLIGNSRSYANMLAAELRERLGLEVVTADSLAAAHDAMATGGTFFLALTGLVLPDAEPEQIIEALARKAVPMVVVTGVYDDSIRARMVNFPIIDYVLKEAPGTIEYLTWLVRRLERNRQITALVVDRSPGSRAHIAALLALYGFRVLQSADAAGALQVLDTDGAIRLVVLEHAVLDHANQEQDDAGIDGIAFIQQVRLSHPRAMLSVIGVSSSADASQVARFLKNGGNDFLNKPFSREEFFCRISQNIDNLELIGTLQDLATRDYLTGLPNRRHFFELGYKALRGRNGPVAMAMLDVDHFKHVNDTYGHDAGDQALRAVATAIAVHARPQDVVARFGGEEFCLLVPGVSLAGAEVFFERLRESIASLQINVKHHTLRVTISIGVCHRNDGDLHALITEADRLLYLATANGRNQVVCESQDTAAA